MFISLMHIFAYITSILKYKQLMVFKQTNLLINILFKKVFMLIRINILTKLFFHTILINCVSFYLMRKYKKKS